MSMFTSLYTSLYTLISDVKGNISKLTEAMILRTTGYSRGPFKFSISILGFVVLAL